jgi:hypothetical protein
VGVAQLVAALEHPRLGLWLAAIGTVLAMPGFAAGFQLDDYVHRYMLSDRPGAAELLHAYESPFGIANGEPAVSHWQIEQGYAPWWTHPDLLVSLWRPLSEATHRLDALLFPDNSALQHLHSLLWLFALIAATTALYRGVLGNNSVAGVASVMFALDHCHGFAAGWIANRNVLVASTFGVLALHAYVQARATRSLGLLARSLVLLAAALLAGEGAVAIFVYMLGYALFVDRAALWRRVLAVVPHALLIVGWRAVYTEIGRGARFSGLYLDPVREPLTFAQAVLERGPFLAMGQLLAPPAEASVFGPGWTHIPLYLFALLLCAVAVFSLWPLLRVDGRARCFALGSAAAFVLGCSTHPNNRLLFFVGIGVMPLISKLWHDALQNAPYLPVAARPRRILNTFAAVTVGFRLFLSPLMLPVTAYSVAWSAPIANASRDALAIANGRELIAVSSPDYFYLKLVPVLAALEGKRLPAHLRALSFGGVPVQVTRSDERTLELRFHGGILGSPLLELYRARTLPMPVGTRVELEGMSVEVTQTTADGRVSAARFSFAHPLEDERYRWIVWRGDRYVPFAPPPPGSAVAVPPADLRLGW